MNRLFWVKVFWVFLGAVVGSADAAWACHFGSQLHVVVYDSRGNILPRFNLLLKYESGKEQRLTSKEIDTCHLDEGDVTLRVSADGFLPMEQSIKRKRDPIYVNFTLPRPEDRVFGKGNNAVVVAKDMHRIIVEYWPGIRAIRRLNLQDTITKMGFRLVESDPANCYEKVDVFEAPWDSLKMEKQAALHWIADMEEVHSAGEAYSYSRAWLSNDIVVDFKTAPTDGQIDRFCQKYQLILASKFMSSNVFLFRHPPIIGLDIYTFIDALSQDPLVLNARPNDHRVSYPICQVPRIESPQRRFRNEAWRSKHVSYFTRRSIFPESPLMLPTAGWESIYPNQPPYWNSEVWSIFSKSR